MKNVVCLYWGNKYKVEYVKILYNMVQRHLTIPHKFIIYTEHTKMQKLVKGDNVEVRKIPFHDYQGWWNKLTLFSPEANLKGDSLYFDLDVVITDNIDSFFTFEKDSKVVLMRDFNLSTEGFNSSIMRFDQSKMHDKLWRRFIADRPNLLRRFPGDQNLISDFIKNTPGCESYPDSWTQSYKWYDRKGNRYAKADMTYEHNGESLVTVFHGQPNPHESEQEWVKKAWI